MARIEQLQREKAAAETALAADKEAIEAGQAALATAGKERATLEMSIRLLEKAVTNALRTIETLEKALQAAEARVRELESQLSRAQQRLDAANKRSVWLFIGGMVLGVFLAGKR